jgi:hypothetical protein
LEAETGSPLVGAKVTTVFTFTVPVSKSLVFLLPFVFTLSL